MGVVRSKWLRMMRAETEERGSVDHRTWIIKRLIGFEVLKTLGRTPSRIPPWAGTVAEVEVGFTDATVTVDKTVVVMVAMMPQRPYRGSATAGACVRLASHGNEDGTQRRR